MDGTTDIIVEKTSADDAETKKKKKSKLYIGRRKILGIENFPTDSICHGKTANGIEYVEFDHSNYLPVNSESINLYGGKYSF